MGKHTVDPAIAGTRFSPAEFTWTRETGQLLARAAGCSIADDRDRGLLLRGAAAHGHPLIPFNASVTARNRPEVMERLIGGYDVWQAVGRWGSGEVAFPTPLAPEGRGRVSSAVTEVGCTSKGHALVRFTFEAADADTGARIAEGWMLMFLLGCGTPDAGRLTPPRLDMPEGAADTVVSHETPLNVTFDWAMGSGDWNSTHFERKGDNPAPLVHGPRNMALVLHDAARAFAGGDPARIARIAVGVMAAPHYPLEPTETRFWNGGDGRVLGRLVVPGDHRRDGGTGDKVVIDQIEIRVRP